MNPFVSRRSSSRICAYGQLLATSGRRYVRCRISSLIAFHSSLNEAGRSGPDAAQGAQRADLVEPNSNARLVELSGRVLTRSCRPLPQALVDLWHADEHGEYDNGGFRYRGHLFTDAEGGFRFRTLKPVLTPAAARKTATA